MTNTQHTPAPWYYMAGHTQMCSDDSTICEVIKEKPIAEFSTGYEKKHYIFSKSDKVESVEANARLIAAAPELLEALEDSISSLEQYANGDWQPDDETFQSVLAGYRAAIAKARGQSC